MALPVVEKVAEESEAKETTSKFSIVMYSGTADKFIPLGVMSQAAAAMGMEVNIFITGFALPAFTKNPPAELPFPTEFAAMAPMLMQGMMAHNVLPWDVMLRQAKEMGAKIYACSMMSEVMGIKREDFNDLIDDVVGAASFVLMSEKGETFFI